MINTLIMYIGIALVSYVHGYSFAALVDVNAYVMAALVLLVWVVNMATLIYWGIWA